MRYSFLSGVMFGLCSSVSQTNCTFICVPLKEWHCKQAMALRWLWMLVPWRGGWNPRSKGPGQGRTAGNCGIGRCNLFIVINSNDTNAWHVSWRTWRFYILTYDLIVPRDVDVSGFWKYWACLSFPTHLQNHRVHFSKEKSYEVQRKDTKYIFENGRGLGEMWMWFGVTVNLCFTTKLLFNLRRGTARSSQRSGVQWAVQLCCKSTIVFYL